VKEGELRFKMDTLLATALLLAKIKIQRYLTGYYVIDAVTEIARLKKFKRELEETSNRRRPLG
jgi:hypothetical protein